MLWAAGAVIVVASVCQGVAMAQGVAPGFAAPSNTQYAATGDPTVGGTPVLAPAPAPVAGPAGAAGFQGINQDAINAMVDQRLREIEAMKVQQVQQQKACADQQGYVVGSNLAVTANFRDGLFLWLTTPNNDFTMHIGAWMQMDNVWWDQSPALKNNLQGSAANHTNNGVASGANVGGLDNMQDGVYFRRIRPFVEGTFWETGEYRLIVALENDQNDTAGLDEFWVGETKIPVIGTLRAGHVKDPVGLEGDMTASSRCMTFMERSSYSQAIELDQNFVTGLWLSNNYFDERATWSFSIFRPDVAAAEGYAFGDDQWGWQGRLTALPIYENEGRCLWHVGLSGGWRSGTCVTSTGSSEFAENNTVTLACRPEMRDDDPAKQATNGDSSNMLSTGAIACNNEYLLGLETLYIHGPFSVQAEYGWNFLDGAVGVGATVSPKFATPQDYTFNGGYIQVAYTLTGENRAYDKRGGTLAREYFGHTGPISKFFLVRDADGNVMSSWGAWEVAARFSYVDLNDGTNEGGNFYRIQGGEMDGVSLALNWYLNNNLNLMIDYAYDNRYDMPVVVAGAAPGSVPSYPGHTNGVGCRLQFQF